MRSNPVRERVRNYRERLKSSGLKPVQIWVPDPSLPGFAEECRRQSSMIEHDRDELIDIEMLAEIADWGEE
ncbi:Protein of unknown function (DUF3018) [Geobacter argillaceus]|uniref:DUF3018 family protein n=2 Tax=Geobacter argillaceus TaxID=345631 RepID=A0A562WU57_9BACT|nr:antitoxin MazE family protein [Geobacter argillaceus]TWJ33033.1 Protein of unknown function (DUF3018) [Geobacter argillaceus]